MGDIKKIKKKYSKPSHPWRITRIEEESQLCKEYGIPRKTEIWKAIAKLESFKNQAKKLSALNTPQANLEKQNLIKKLESVGLLVGTNSLDVILGLTVKDILNRRLQTIVVKKNLAKSMKQARQMITHRHILVDNKLVTSPGYFVRISEDNTIELSAKSAFYDTNHPERTKQATKRVHVKKVEKKGFRPRKR